MLKSSITDSTIKIIPSKQLIDFLKTIVKDHKLLPKNVQKVLGKLKSNHQLPNSQTTCPTLNAAEKQVVKTLNSEQLKTSILKNEDTGDNSFNNLESIDGMSSQRVQDIIPNEEEPNVSDTRPFLTNSDLKWLFHILQDRRKTQETPYLHELIEGSEILLPQNEYLERNPVLEARCRKLRKEQEAREYEAMTKNVDNVRNREPEDTIAFQMRMINRQLIAILQFVFSVAAGFAFGFIGIPLGVGELDFGFRLLLGIMFALIIALAEIYFLAKKLNEDYEVKPSKSVLNDSELLSKKMK